MITGAVRNQVDQPWNTFWSGGISNPLTVIEQITYLLFAKRLDDLQTTKEAQANLTGEKVEDPLFTKKQAHLRWSHFQGFDPQRKFTNFRDEVFPFIKSLNGRAGSSYNKFMQDTVFIMPNPALLDKVINLIDAIPMHDRDTKGDLYEYMLAKIATAGQNGQFRTPRHIINMMVELVDEYLQHKGYFTRHNIKSKPDSAHPDYVKNQDSNHGQNCLALRGCLLLAVKAGKVDSGQNLKSVK